MLAKCQTVTTFLNACFSCSLDARQILHKCYHCYDLDSNTSAHASCCQSCMWSIMWKGASEGCSQKGTSAIFASSGAPWNPALSVSRANSSESRSFWRASDAHLTTGCELRKPNRKCCVNPVQTWKEETLMESLISQDSYGFISTLQWHSR